MSAAIFEKIKAALAGDPKLGAKVGGVLAFVLTGPSSEWVVDCKKSTVTSGSGKADCTITISEENFLALVSGKLQGMQAFMSGKMKIKGNMGLAQKFGALTDAVKKAGGAPKPAAATAPTPAAAAGSAPSGFQSTAVFEKIAANLKADPTLLKKVKGVFAFNITKGPGGASAQWTVDAKTAGEVKPAAPPKVRLDRRLRRARSRPFGAVLTAPLACCRRPTARSQLATRIWWPWRRASSRACRPSCRAK